MKKGKATGPQEDWVQIPRPYAGYNPSPGLSFPNCTVRVLDPLLLKIQSIMGSLQDAPNYLSVLNSRADKPLSPGP